MHVVKFTAKLNKFKSPNNVEIAKAILISAAKVLQCETKKIIILDQK